MAPNKPWGFRRQARAVLEALLNPVSKIAPFSPSACASARQPTPGLPSLWTVQSAVLPVAPPSFAAQGAVPWTAPPSSAAPTTESSSSARPPAAFTSAAAPSPTSPRDALPSFLVAHPAAAPPSSSAIRSAPQPLLAAQQAAQSASPPAVFPSAVAPPAASLVFEEQHPAQSASPPEPIFSASLLSAGFASSSAPSGVVFPVGLHSLSATQRAAPAAASPAALHSSVAPRTTSTSLRWRRLLPWDRQLLRALIAARFN